MTYCWRLRLRGCGQMSYRTLSGWVATKMGGPSATDDLDQGHRTQVWLAASEDAAAKVTGGYFYHLRQRTPKGATHEVALQEKLVEACRWYSGVDLRV